MKYLHVTSHAKKRLRQRFGLQSVEAMRSWTLSRIKQGTFDRTETNGHKIYRWENAEIVLTSDERTLVSVIDHTRTEEIKSQIGTHVGKELRKLKQTTERALRKAEINVSEITLNMLKARNPKIKAALNEKLTKADDEKDALVGELKAIRNAASEFGVEV